MHNNTCTAVPYEGGEPFVFVSFCHTDEERVYRSLNWLSDHGVRFWYDRGINVGEEWPEIIAHHLDASSAVLAFFSSASLHSHNCRREFNFVISENKPCVAVLLEDIEMTPVMKLQFSTVQMLRASGFSTDEAMWESLDRSSVLSGCKTAAANPPARPTVTLIRRSTGERIQIARDGFHIGRRKTQNDYVIADNPAVSRLHAVFHLQPDGCRIEDLGSTSYTYVNDTRVLPGTTCPVHNGDVLDIGREIFFVTTEGVTK